MFKKVLYRSAFIQSLLLVVLLACVFTIVGVYEYQRMRDNLKTNLDRAESIPFSDYFPEDQKRDVMRYERKIAALFVLNNSGIVMISNDNFCPSDLREEIIYAARDKAEGQIKNDDYCIAFRKKVIDKGTVVYVYDFTEEYNGYRNNFVLIITLAVIISIVVVFSTFYFSKGNLVPIKAAFEKQKELVANASHELKTPLTILSTQTEIVRDYAWNDEQKKWVDGIQEQVERMRKMVTEMLELARFEAVRNEDDFVVFNFSELVDRVALGIEALAFENNVVCISDITPRAMVFADPNGMEKAVYSLMENAVKYTPMGEKIYIKVKIESKNVIFVVRNTGIACPKEDIPFLFDRFYRGDKAHTSGDNFGLGLPIAHAIVEANKGKIGCTSKNEKDEVYTEFIVCLKNITDKQIQKKERELARKKERKNEKKSGNSKE